jgi:hypothetical protein
MIDLDIGGDGFFEALLEGLKGRPIVLSGIE